MFSVCPHLGGGGSGVRSKSNPGGQVKVQTQGGQVKVQTQGGSGQSPTRGGGGSGQSPTGGGSGQSNRGGQSRGGGDFRSKSNPGGQVKVQRVGGEGQVSPARGGDQSSWGGVSPGGGGGGSDQLGGSASCALLQAVCLLRSRRRTFLFYIHMVFECPSFYMDFYNACLWEKGVLLVLKE